VDCDGLPRVTDTEKRDALRYLKRLHEMEGGRRSEQEEEGQVNPTFWSDPGFLINAVAINGRLLKSEPQCSRGKTDAYVVMVAIKCGKWPGALAVATEEIRAEKDVVLEAMKLDPWVIEYAHDSLKIRDASLWVLAFKTWEAAGRVAPSHLLRRVAKLRHVRFRNPDVLWTWPGFVGMVVSHNPSALEHAAASLQDDADVVIKALRRAGTLSPKPAEGLGANFFVRLRKKIKKVKRDVRGNRRSKASGPPLPK